MDLSALSELLSSVREKASVVKAKGRTMAGTVDKFLDSHEQGVLYVLLGIIAGLAGGLRLLPFYYGSLEFPPSKPVFTQLAGYDSFRGIRYVMENFIPLFSDTLANYPSDVSVMTGGVLDMVFALVVSVLTLFWPVEQSISAVLYLTDPVFIVVSVLLIYKLVKELFEVNRAIMASLLFAVIPSQLVLQTMAGAGSYVGVYISLILAISLSVLYLSRFARRTVLIWETLREELLQWNTYAKFTVLLSVVSILFVLSEPIHVVIYYGLLGIIVLQYSIISSFNKSEVTETVPLSVLPSITIVSVAVVSVSVLYSTYTEFHAIIAGGMVILVGLLAAIDRLSERFEVSESFLVSLISLGALVITSVVVLYAPDASEVLQAVFMPTRDSVYFQEVNSIFVYQIEALLFQNFGFMGLVALAGFLMFYLNTLYDTITLGVDMERILASSIGVAALILGIVSVDWFPYTAIGVAIFGTYMVFWIADLTNIFELSEIDLKAYHVLVVIMLIGLFIPVFVYPIEGTAVATAQQVEVQEEAWADASAVLEDISESPTDPYGSPMESPSYGVVTWADHVEEPVRSIGERPPTGISEESAGFSSRYLLSQTELEAEVLEDRYDAEPRYIMLDWRSVSVQGQMQFMIQKHPRYSIDDLYQPVFDSQTQQLAFELHTDHYYNSLAVRLYYFMGSHVEPDPITASYSLRQAGDRQVAVTFLSIDRPRENHINVWPNQRAANQYVEDPTTDPTAEQEEGEGEEQQEEESDEENQSTVGQHQIGGIGINPTEEVDALKHYRYVASSSQSLQDYPSFMRSAVRSNQYAGNLQIQDFLREDARVKVFERVEGATIEGTNGPPGQTVRFVIALENEKTGTAFQYVQTVETDEDGNFEATIPYSSKGTPGKYTVQPTQNYQVISQLTRIEPNEEEELVASVDYWYAEMAVEEEAVVNGQTVEVELTQYSPEELYDVIQGDGVLQPQEDPGQSDDDDEEEDSSSEETDADPE